MALGSASEEIKKSNELWEDSNRKALRDQQEEDFGLWGPYKFTMDKGQGKWEDVTTNSPKILANKIFGLLDFSNLQLFIEVDDETRKKRKEISKTEQLALGCIWLADRALTALPSGKSIQASLSFYATVKGGTCKSVYFYEDEDGTPRPDIRVYDPTWCQWIEGERDIMWFCHRSYMSKHFVEKSFEKQIKKGFNYGSPDPSGRILAYTFWDDKSWKTAINGEYVDEDDHNLGYVPVNVRSCGAAPYIQSKAFEDTMKWSWNSAFSSIRDHAKYESELLSIILSKGKEAGKIKGIANYNSDKTGSEVPENMQKLGYSNGGRNEIVWLDEAKGQSFFQTVEPPSNQQILEAYNLFRSNNILATIDPIAYGQMTRSGSGALAAELRSAALEFINPFRKCIEDDYVWIAEECVKQFKNGNFSTVSLEGTDAKRNKFYADINSNDIEEKHFSCNLVPDKLRDEIQELGAAIQKVQSGLTSRRTARLAHNIVEDPDREQDIIDEELAAQDPVFKNYKLAKYWKDQGTPEGDEMAQYYLMLAKKTIEAAVQLEIQQLMMPVQPEGMMPGGGIKPPMMTPQAQAGRIAAEPRTLRDIGY